MFTAPLRARFAVTHVLLIGYDVGHPWERALKVTSLTLLVSTATKSVSSARPLAGL